MSIKSIKQVLNTVPKRVVAILGLVVAIVIPMAVQAWGPGRTLFTMANPADYNTFNSITDNPDVGDERNFLQVSQEGQRGWSDVAVMEEGKTYYARMYVHNNAKARLNMVATNVRAKLNMPNKSTVWGKQFEINGFLSSDNSRPNEIWDNMVLKSNRVFHVEILSAKYYNNIRTRASSGFDLSLGDLITPHTPGALLGYQQMDGRIPGCLEYSGYVLVKFRPVFKTTPPPPPEKPKPGYDIEKTVDKTTAKPGETINYTITAKNTGKEDLTNVKITDKLPKNYDKASEKVDAPSTITGSIIKNGEVTIAKLPVGTKATIKISYTIKKNIDCGKHIIKNIAHGTTDQDKTEDSSGNNEVTTIVDVDCKPNVPPTTPPNTPPTTPPAPTTPSVIAQTGTSDNTIAAILGLGTLAGALTAYIRSRKYANR